MYQEFIRSKILSFADKYLDGNLEAFISFPLTRLKGDREFGCPGRSFDADDTEIMRYVYAAIFAEIWPGMSIENLKNGEFRGDTLNTFNTMFGQPTQESEHPGLDKFNPSEELKAKVVDFHHNYHTIGNMIVLPNLRLNGKSINTYRGCKAQWRDFFDRFLPELKTVLVSDGGDDTLLKLVAINHVHFALYKSTEGFNSLVDGLFLNDYLDAHSNPVISSKAYYFWKSGLSREDYSAEAIRYVDFANAVIENRGKQMISSLLKFLTS